ncbi:hypothetical protein CEXT_353831 [Caerostris extrusa]|uniref:Uncharacterized protein n=1 Tax=Caerostris extrusa TaxID=172846 RepID=A0AAV4X5I2_CAEEX|nr:hypothetical protein CEXT_353831 [Caerostris extrusa]
MCLRPIWRSLLAPCYSLLLFYDCWIEYTREQGTEFPCFSLFKEGTWDTNSSWDKNVFCTVIALLLLSPPMAGGIDLQADGNKLIEYSTNLTQTDGSTLDMNMMNNAVKRLRDDIF